MAFDLLIFALTAYKTISGVWQRGMPLTRLLIRDASMYFGIMSLVNVANVLTYYTTWVMRLTQVDNRAD
ncbi:hypothetical protein GGG16DRAFT_109455 [Schizophyllum commune]